MKPYDEIYESAYYERCDGMEHWNAGTLKLGDTLSAFGYALGIGSFEELRQLVGFTDERDILESPAHKLVSVVMAAKRRRPISVLDVGGGRGELACCFAMMGTKVQVIEPHPRAADWLSRTADKLFGWKQPPASIKLITKQIQDCTFAWTRSTVRPRTSQATFMSMARRVFKWVHGGGQLAPEASGNREAADRRKSHAWVRPDLDLTDVDTLIFCESIEHIPKEWFDPFWAKVRPALGANKGRLIVVNWPSFHPIGIWGDEHCRAIDDIVYDQLAEGGRTAYRQGSHLVVDF
jgi:hypothetical protein